MLRSLISLYLAIFVRSVVSTNSTDQLRITNIPELQYLINELSNDNESFPHTIFKRPELAIEKLSNVKLPNVSVNCVRDFVAFAFGLIKEDTWAVQMLDAYGKIGSGISQGNAIWPGSFALCNKVVQGPPYGNTTQNVHPFHGQFCWLEISPNFVFKPMPKYKILMRIGLCVPSSCAPDDLHMLIKELGGMPKLENYIKSLDSSCIPKSRNLWTDYRASICLVLFLLMGLLVSIATSYDIYRIFILKEPREKEQNYQAGWKQKKRIDNDEDDECLADGEEQAMSNCGNSDEPLIINNTGEIGIPGKILLCFSFYTNARRIFTSTPRDKNLMCLNGIRVFSMIWTVAVNTCFVGAMTSDNPMIALDWVNTIWFAVLGQVFSVDSFFVLSGLLVTYLYLVECEKNDGKISWLKFYFHRYWRLTPVYAAVLFIFANYISPYYSNSPFWPLNGINGDHCDKYWWWNLLYINNFQKYTDLCMGHSWYLSNDMQFFVLSPLILIFLNWCLPISAVVAGGLILASWIATGVIATDYNIGFSVKDAITTYTLFDKIYIKPYCRIAPYIIGMICGYLIHKSKCQYKLNKVVVISGWLIAILMSSLVAFGTYNSDMTQDLMSLFFSVARSAWAISLAWMIFACCNGYGGFVNSILAWPFWQSFARLTYTCYLIHFVVVHLAFLDSDAAPHFALIYLLILALGTTVASYFFAIFISSFFEEPFRAMEKLFIP